MTGAIDLEAWALFFLRYGVEFAAVFLVLAGGLYLWIRLVARPQPPLSPELVGTTGIALTEVSSVEGRVEIGGRKIRAIAQARIGVGSRIRVLEVDGLVARVAADA